MVGTLKKSIETVVFRWFSRKVRHICEGGFRRSTMYLLTLVSPTSMPSLRSSPGMRGDPQSVFSRIIFRISLRTSFDTGGRAALAATNPSSPKQSKSVAAPSYDGFRFDDAESRAPFGPGPTKPSPQERVDPVKFRLLDRKRQRKPSVSGVDLVVK